MTAPGKVEPPEHHACNMTAAPNKLLFAGVSRLTPERAKCLARSEILAAFLVASLDDLHSTKTISRLGKGRNANISTNLKTIHVLVTAMSINNRHNVNEGNNGNNSDDVDAVRTARAVMPVVVDRGSDIEDHAGKNSPN